ncbi:unnamed protein product [Ilex paraguariensis]|uniref:Small nuclear RNA activating complex (SNAPc), subunit SNAP43 protein n=1 Tax=Ilex paraguariensis TaxID=185542 RepID=A0ABC8SXR7_9AQUA
MDLKPFKLDIDELINEFAQGESTTLAELKSVWLSKKFSFIFEASPSTNQACFMQSLYAHCIGYMMSTASISHRLGGFYCLYCLYETQPFKPPFKIYLSLGELKGLKNLVVEAKAKGIKVVSVLVKRMLERNVFLFGFVDINESSVTERVNQLTDMQNARIQVAHKKLFADTRIEHFLHMDLGMELDIGELKKMSTDYAVAKDEAIREASKVVDVQNIKHVTDNKRLIGDVVEKTAEDWNAQKELFYQQIKYGQRPAEEPPKQGENENFEGQEREANQNFKEQGSNEKFEEQDDDGSFGKELEDELLSQLLTR